MRFNEGLGSFLQPTIPSYEGFCKINRAVFWTKYTNIRKFWTMSFYQITLELVDVDLNLELVDPNL